jgi:glycosyltransferase involved in cell wall biosynthesis
MKSRTVVYVQYTSPAAYPPLQHSAVILASAGWEVAVLGVTQPRVAGLQFAEHSRIHVKLFPTPPAGWRQKLHYLRFCLWALSEIRSIRPDWVYASDTLSAPVAYCVSWFKWAMLVYHEHDTPEERHQSRFMRLLLTIRRHMLKRAQIVVVPNAERGQLLQAAGVVGHNLLCVWNCPQSEEAAQAPQTDSHDAFTVIYHGSIVPARFPESVIQALALLPNVKLRLRGYGTAGHENYVDQLRELARQLGVESRFDIKLVVPTRGALFDDVRTSDLGLSLMPRQTLDVNERNMTGASNKAFEYLAQGIPLLVSDMPDWRHMFVESGVARACCPEDHENVASTIAWFADHQAEARQMGERGRQLVLAKWNYEQQFAPVLRRMSAAS